MNGKTTTKGNSLAATATYVLTLCVTFFYIQAYRNIIVYPDAFPAVKFIIYTFLFAPFLAGILNLAPAHRLLAFIGAAAAIIGRRIFLQPDMARYFSGEYLIVGGFWLFFVSRLMRATKRSETAGTTAAMFTAGFLTAPILHLALRSADKVQSAGIITALLLIGAAALVLDTTIEPKSEKPTEATNAPRAGLLAGLSIFLAAIPIHYLFQWALKPEMFSGIADASYRAAVVGAKIALCLAVADALFGGKRLSRLRVGGLALRVCFPLVLFAFLFKLPTGMITLIAIMAALAFILTALTPSLTFFCTRRIPGQSIFLGLGGSAASVASFGLTIYLLEQHAPALHLILLGALVAGLLILMLATSKSSKTIAIPKGAAALALACAFIITIFGGPPAPRHKAGAGRLVLASLYTWYGVPGQPFGDFGLEGLHRPPSLSAWDITASTLHDVGTSIVRPNLQGTPRPFLSVHGMAALPDNNSITLSSPVDAALLPLTGRTYIRFDTMADVPQARNIRRAAFFVRLNGTRYEAQIRPETEKLHASTVVFPNDFKSRREKGPNTMGFDIICERPGPCAFQVSDLTASNWKHWDEDYHTAKVDGKWRNDPPDTLAAAHHVTYNGKPWPEIAPYSHDGYYDSWDPGVVRSQLQLMEKAGIDAVMIMHPHSPIIVQRILDTLDELKSPLKVCYYGGYDLKTGTGIDYIKRFGKHPRYLKVDGRPVWILAPTGLLEKPYKQYEKDFAELRKRTNAFLVGDQYVPPKEEMLSILDGHYYYDTTGLYRARWGGRNIPVAQPDGTFVRGFGNLVTIFRAISSIVHERNGLFIATVIPGFDNTRVHGFIDSPFYDGRPGTVVKRERGKTYAETWDAAIRSGADWACIVTWNELHEGTEIEPTKEDGTFYVRETAKWAKMFREKKLPEMKK